MFLDTQEKILWTPSQWDFHNLLRSSGGGGEQTFLPKRENNTVAFKLLGVGMGVGVSKFLLVGACAYW